VRCRFCKPEYQLRYLGEQAEIEKTARACARAAPHGRPAAGCDMNLALRDIKHNLGRFLLTCL
jgi:hypothetical protein